MKHDSLEKLYEHEIKVLYSAETQLMEALKMLQTTAIDEELKGVFQDHLTKTENHLARLEEIFSGLDLRPGGQKCHGMGGLIDERQKLMQGDLAEIGIDAAMIDAAMVAAPQPCEPYPMAGYGTTRTYAERLGRTRDAGILQDTLNKEGPGNKNRTRLAEQRLNLMAQKS